MPQKSQVTLEVEDSRGRRMVAVDRFPATVGRHADCAVLLADDKASRRHAVLEDRDGQIVIQDLGSQNGLRINGERELTGRLRLGDVVTLGRSTLRVASLSTPVPAAPGPEDSGETEDSEETEETEDAPREVSPALRRLGRRRALRRVFIPLILVLVVGGAAWGIYQASRPVDVIPTGSPEEDARAELALLEQESTRAARVDADLLVRTRKLVRKYAEVDFGGRNPIETFHADLLRRRQVEIQNRLGTIAENCDMLLEQRRFGEVFIVAESATRNFEEEPREDREYLQRLLDHRRDRVEEAYRAAEQALKFLESNDLRDEAAALYERVVHEFADTSHEAGLLAGQEAFAASLAAVEKRDRERVKHLVERVPEFETWNEETLLAPVLYDAIRRGVFAGRRYDFNGSLGTPIHMDADMLVTVKSIDREWKVSFGDIGRRTQLAIALDGVEDDALLVVAEIAYRWAHADAADRLVLRYLALDLDTERRRDEVNEFLAEVRDLESVPPGGFIYERGFGWMDAAQRREVEVIGEARTLTGRLVADTDMDALRVTFDQIIAHHENESLSRETRMMIRRDTIAALDLLESDLLAGIPSSVEKTFVSFRRAREKLNAQREAARKVIFDIVVYLPENHPDWPRGDHVNGQQKVDEVVALVRSTWEGLGQGVGIKSRVLERIERLRLVYEEFHERLYHEKPLEDGSLVVDLLNNARRIAVPRTFALDRREALLREFNDRVRRYNRDFSHADLPQKDLDHIVVVNDYREMMGLSRTFVDIRICRATQKHSAACNAAGAIWHDGPDGTPGSRARAEGFTAAVGENVAIGYGNPVDIWVRGWYRASDHHRNALGSGWNCMGYGYVGQVGTENFASIPPPFEWPFEISF